VFINVDEFADSRRGESKTKTTEISGKNESDLGHKQ
jgi:hypothetical protein